MLHRLWLSTEDVIYRLQSGVWNTDAAQALAADPEALERDGRRLAEVRRDLAGADAGQRPEPAQHA
jgi:hypothetical protein